MAENNQILYDIEGTELLTRAILNLVNEYPALNGDVISFASLAEDGGKAFYPSQGAVIQSERVSVTGHVTQDCLYPFVVVYRAGTMSGAQKIRVKEWLDTLGKWLEKQDVVINDEHYTLSDYPVLTGGRVIKEIKRQSPSYLDTINENKTENWVIQLQVVYETQFDK